MPRQQLIVRPAPLPATNETLHLKTPVSLNDRVKQNLMNGAYEQILPLLEACHNQYAVHGSVYADRIMAALQLQNIARKAGDDWLAGHSLHQIDRAINVALRAIKDGNGHSIDRKSRKLLALEHARHD